MTIFRARDHGPSGASASAYHTSPTMLLPQRCSAIITHFPLCAFHAMVPPWVSTASPVSASTSARGASPAGSPPNAS